MYWSNELWRSMVTYFSQSYSYAMSIANIFRGGMLGAMTKESVHELLDYFHSQGGNFIDTANNYQNE